MSKVLVRDVFEPQIKFSLMEDAGGDVDGTHVLARVKGEFFFPDGKSRNKRFYPAQAWENVLANKDVQARLQKRLMFGTIGHDQELNDKAIREGKVSHFMVKAYIEDGKGMGEALVMNTPVGNILNTVLRSGSQLAVSSRADGRFKGTVDGMPAIDPDNFLLIGWDFVIDPGFLEANPVIAEAYNKTVNELKKGEDNKMDNDSMKKLVEHITDENHGLKTTNGSLTTENTSLRESNSVLSEENKHLKGEVETIKESAKLVDSYKAIGTVEEIQESLDLAEKAGKILKVYEALGTPAEIKKAFEVTAAHMTSLKENFGSTREISQVFRAAGKVNERLSKIGTIPEIEKLVENQAVMLKEADAAKAETEKQAMMKEAEDIAKEVGAPVDDVMELLKSKSGPEVKAIYAKAEESFKKKHGIVEGKAKPAPSNPYTKTSPINENKPANPAVNMNAPEEIRESLILSKRYAEADESSVVGKSRIERFNEQFGK